MPLAGAGGRQDAISMALLDRIKSAVKDAAEPMSTAPHDLRTAVGALLNLNRLCLERRREKQGALSENLLEELEAQNRVISEALPRFHASLAQLEGAIFDAKYSKSHPDKHLEPSADIMKDVLVYSHKLSYSSHAPLGKHPQPVYGPFAPPAPSEHHMQFSKLQEFARTQAEKQQAQAAEAARVKAEQQQAAAQGAGGTPLGPAAVDAGVLQALQGLELPLKMPDDWRPPEGWKPGDPIPMLQPPPGLGANVPPLAAKAEPVEAAEASPQLNFEMDEGIEFDFVLNAETVESEEDSDSDMDDDDEDYDDDD